MVKEDKQTWKANYFIKIEQLFDEYSKCFMVRPRFLSPNPAWSWSSFCGSFQVDADNVGSKQMQQIRMSLRGRAVILMGKNTMMRKAIRGMLEKRPDLEKILSNIVGNIGFVFTNNDLVDIRDLLLDNKVKAPARAGAIAPLDVKVPAQNTGLGPEKTSFFQALSIPTKITKGTIEIIQEVPLIKAGDKVGMSEATLLNMLNISPFSYGLVLKQVFEDGAIFSPTVLDITDDDLRQRFMEGVANVAAICLSIGYPTVASVPHSIANGFKNLLAVAAVTEIEFKEAEKLKAYLADPSAFAAAAPAAAAASAAAPAAAKAEEPEEESEDDDMGFGLFD